MYGCDYSVGCLQVSAHRIGDGISAACELIGASPYGLQASSFRVGGGLVVSCRPVGEDTTEVSGLVVDAYRVGGGLNVTCGIVCSTTDDTGNYFLVQEGLFILADGKRFKLK